MLVIKFFETVYQPLRLRGRADGNTARLYRCTIRALANHLGRPPEMADITDDLTVSRYLETRAAKLSPYTVEKERTQIAALHRLAWERRLPEAPFPPTVRAGVLPETSPRAWTIADLQKLAAAAGETRGYVGGKPAGIWWRALVAVLWESGERISAVIDAPASSWQPPVMRIPAAYRKGSRADAVYQFSGSTVALVEAAKSDGPTLFGWPHDKAYLWTKFRQIVQRAGIDGGRAFRFHGIRRAACSHFAAAGGDPVAFLRHSSARITNRWYLDREISETGPKAYEILPAIDGRDSFPENRGSGRSA